LMGGRRPGISAYRGQDPVYQKARGNKLQLRI
jgi:hypothetical protein